MSIIPVICHNYLKNTRSTNSKYISATSSRSVFDNKQNLSDKAITINKVRSAIDKIKMYSWWL